MITRGRVNLPDRHGGFTLVELLISIMIVTILASMVLFAMASVTETARVDRTRAQITRINELLLEKWESYQTRRVPPTLREWEMLQTADGAAQMQPRFVGRNRLQALRELMRLELPDRITDVTDPPKVLVDPVRRRPLRPALSRAYVRLAQKRTAAAGTTWSAQYQQSECLHLILSQMREADFSALEFFSENEIGDLDGDGMPEILDAWGTPIRWLRWAPGFISPLQPVLVADNPTPLVSDSLELRASGLLQNGRRQGYELFDVARIDRRAADTYDGADKPFELHPLIISAGPDREFDIVFSADKPISWSATQPPNDPYYVSSDTFFHLLGSVEDLSDTDGDGRKDGDGVDNSLDNIHNHLVETT
jgi:prepilin-type N-terminal cleavage/methylation domain-containing protein